MEFSSDHRMYVDEHDLEALYNHLEDIELITDPYLLLAADIDDSKSIDDTDLELLYQMVNGEILEFPTDHNWRCIEKDYNFKFPNTPFEEAKYFEPMRLNNVKEDIVKDFYTIKKGNLVFIVINP